MGRAIIDKLEILLKPTKTRRYVAILFYMGYLALSAYLEYTFLDVTRPIRVCLLEAGPPWCPLYSVLFLMYRSNSHKPSFTQDVRI